MRKYVILITFTSIIIAGIVIFGKMIQATGMEVTVYKIKPRPVKQTVSCSGRVEAAESEDVYVKIPCVVGEIYVSPGDEVSEGDVLFSVDVDATKEVIAAAAGILPSMVTEEQISKDVITPVSGNVRSVNVVKGGAINTETPCAVISSSDALQVKVSIQESRLRNIKVGQTATVSGTAFLKEKYQGVVSYISSSARQQYVGTVTETVVDAIITLSEKDDSLKPGLSAKSEILVGSQDNCIIVPYEYVLQDEENNEYVYLYKDGFCVKCVIETGKEFSDGLEVISGLSSGDKVIESPDKIEKSGIRVKIAEETKRI
ncbi:MAG TPA: hypothetical protein DEB10_06325 [Ruminococcaceae bacterium]|jgi:multidrug efflux pump subunit AcrA (membrane-fusion protein)|nr:hypothetical protein [Oscillospiraceae bacterium]HCA30973.1 hypothetical protein [Oscillospiraceae bacterium]